jgi:hypothetical protein
VELVGLVVVPDRHEGMAAEVGFRGLGHGDQPAGGGDGGFCQPAISIRSRVWEGVLGTGWV